MSQDRQKKAQEPGNGGQTAPVLPPHKHEDPAAATVGFAVAALTRTYGETKDKAKLLPRLRTALVRITALPGSAGIQDAVNHLTHMEQEAAQIAGEHLQKKRQLAASAAALASSTSWKDTRTTLDRLAHEWRLTGWSDEEATAPFRKQFNTAVATFTTRQEQWFDEQRMRGASAGEFREYLCTRAEQLAGETDDTMWPASTERLRQLVQLWKKTGRDHEDPASNERFAAAQHAFEEHRDAWYDANEARKEQLLHRIEVLAETAEGPVWEAARREVNDILEQDWHDAGPLPRQRHEDMERRLQQTLETFRVHEEEAERAALEQKQAIIARIGLLGRHQTGNWKATRATLLELQEAYAALGPVAQEHETDLLQSYRAACQSVVSVLQTLRGNSTERRTEIIRRIRELTANAGKTAAWRDARDKILVLQKQYAGAGPISHAEGEVLWQEYRKVCDRFFEEYRTWTGGNVGVKEQLCSEAEELLQEPDAFEAKEKAKKLQQRWKASGPVPPEQNEALWTRFSEALDRIFERARREWEGLRDL